MKTSKRVNLFSLVVILIGLFSFPTGSQASSMSTQAGFEVTTIPPEQQTSKNLGSFSFNAKPGESYNMGFKIKNYKKYAIKVKIIPTVAVTNSNGDIIYNKVTKKRDSSLKMDFTKLGPKKVTISLQPNEEKTVNEVLTMPKKQFNGAILGGYSIYSPTVNKKMAKAKVNKKSKVQITNVYSVSVGAAVLSGKYDKVKPNIKLNRVLPTAYLSKPAVLINIQDFKPMFIANHQMKIRARIFPRGSSNAIHTATRSNMSFASNSNFDFPVSWGNDPMKAGNYTAKVRIKTTDRTWNLTRNFTITADQAQKANSQNPNLKKDYTFLIVLIIIIVILLIIALFYWFYKKGQTSNDK